MAESIAAERLTAAVPADLPALRFHSRPAVAPGVRLLAVGDIGFSGRVSRAKYRAESLRPLDAISPFLKTADIVFGNLETPLVARTPDPRLFAGAQSGASLLAEAGFHLVHIANNHIGDYGPAGIAATMEVAAANQLSTLGAGFTSESARRPAMMERGGLKIGWLGCGRTRQKQGERGPYYWEFDEKELLTAVATTKPKVDFLVVSIHSGLMYLDYPDPAQRRTSAALADAGADLILWHHAHVLQGVERLPSGTVVCHSLGNFLLDTEEGHVRANVAEREQREGGVFLFDIDREGIFQTAVLPTWIAEDCTVEWAVGERGERILDRLHILSGGLKEDYSHIFKDQRAERNMGVTLRVITHHLRRGNVAVLWPALRQMRLRHIHLLWHWLRNRVGSGAA